MFKNVHLLFGIEKTFLWFKIEKIPKGELSETSSSHRSLSERLSSHP